MANANSFGFFPPFQSSVKFSDKNLNALSSLTIAFNPPILLFGIPLLVPTVVLLKVDMLQVLNINVDYADADGD